MTLLKKQSTKGVSDKVKEDIKNTPNYAAGNSGMFNTHVVEPVPFYNVTEAETVYKGRHNSFIIMGRDRPRDVESGYGGIGSTHCGTIDIIAGLNGALAAEVNEDNEIVYTDKSPELDSARIYISQRIDVDNNFNLPEGSVGNATAKSAVAVKADAVRLIGRDGIKLVTGTDVYDGQGVRIDIQQGIDLIAGNNDEDLQPLVKGDNLVEALQEIIDLITDLNGIVSGTLTMYLQLVTALVAHTHLVPFATPFPVTPSPDFAIFSTSQFANLTKLITEALLHQKNSVATKLNYTVPIGSGFVNSIHNNTN